MDHLPKKLLNILPIWSAEQKCFEHYFSTNLLLSCDLLLKTRFLIFTIVKKTNKYQIKCNQRKTNERNDSDRKIKSFCELFEEKKNSKSHYTFLFKMFRYNFYIASYNMIIWLKSLLHLLTVQLAYAQEVCCPLRLKCMWLTRCSYFGRLRKIVWGRLP